jgi:threonine aldolase
MSLGEFALIKNDSTVNDSTGDPLQRNTAALTSRRQFASDNYSGICPEAWQAMADANAGHAQAYGEDRWTARAADRLRDLFETDCEVFFVFNGTSANSLALSALCQSYHSVLCHELAHIETDECGAPEFFSNGTKVLLAKGENGKIDPAAVEYLVERRSDIHYPKPRVLSLTQATEAGTVYDVAETRRLCESAQRFGLYVHMDGARFANAIVSLNVAPKAITWQAGVDVLCFGGTKNGLAVGEAVIFFRRELANEFAFRCKQAGQLASKMRYLSAPWCGLLETDAWLRNARQANQAAAELARGCAEIPGIELLYPRQANSVFLRLPPTLETGLQNRGWRFYRFIGAGGARFMCSWDTTSADVQALLTDLRQLSAGP